MWLLFLLLIIVMFFPVLLIPFAVFIGLFLLFLPLKFTIDSFFNLFLVPGQLYKIAKNPDLRKNHALEHATVNILEDKFGYENLSGYSTDEGFYIIGADDPVEVKNAADYGLTLMKKGKSELAIHDNCGTSLIVANFISAVIFIFLLFYSGFISIFNMIIAILLAHLIGPYLGKVIQHYFTTTSDVMELEVASTHYEKGNLWRQPIKIFVKTTKIPYLKR